MHSAHFVTLTRIGPIGNEYAAIGSTYHIHSAKPRILDKAHIRSVLRDVIHLLWLKGVTVQALTVDVDHIGSVAILGRPVVTLVNHEARMRMTATGGACSVGYAAANIGPHF